MTFPSSLHKPFIHSVIYNWVKLEYRIITPLEFCWAPTFLGAHISHLTHISLCTRFSPHLHFPPHRFLSTHISHWTCLSRHTFVSIYGLLFVCCFFCNMSHLLVNKKNNKDRCLLSHHCNTGWGSSVALYLYLLDKAEHYISNNNHNNDIFLSIY